jgi:hypothetical protein
MVTYGSVVARNVFTVDWGMPASMGKRLRIVDQPRALLAITPEPGDLGDVIWFGPNARDLSRAVYFEIRQIAMHRKFRMLYWYEHPNYHCPNHPDLSLRRDVTKNYA